MILEFTPLLVFWPLILGSVNCKIYHILRHSYVHFHVPDAGFRILMCIEGFMQAVCTILSVRKLLLSLPQPPCYLDNKIYSLVNAITLIY